MTEQRKIHYAEVFAGEYLDNLAEGNIAVAQLAPHVLPPGKYPTILSDAGSEARATSDHQHYRAVAKPAHWSREWLIEVVRRRALSGTEVVLYRTTVAKRA